MRLNQCRVSGLNTTLIQHLLTLTGGVSTMRRIAGPADTALLCTTCIHAVCMYSRLAVNPFN